jgi:hypothetical protein
LIAKTTFLIFCFLLVMAHPEIPQSCLTLCCVVAAFNCRNFFIAMRNCFSSALHSAACG